MHRLLTIILDSVFPPSADALCVRKLKHEDMHLLSHPKTVRSVITLTEFKNPHIRALIHEAKFAHNTKAFRLLGTLCALHLNADVAQYDCIIPIPLSRARMRARGYNQVVEVLRCAKLTIPVHEDILVRTRNTQPQTELNKERREKNMLGAFAVKGSERITGKRILLIDDVFTTGATLHEAKATLLLHHPTSVTCLTLAH